VQTQYDYQGTFEAHITVNTKTLAERDKFHQFCQVLGIKCVLIELPQGITRSQPMTASYHQGKLTSVMVEVGDIAHQLSVRGFEVIRLKIEAMVNNHDVPITDAQARALPVSNYFEFHVKALLSGEMSLAALGKYCLENDAHLSANALKQMGGEQQRFITMRLYGVGKQSAVGKFQALLATLKAKGIKLSQPQLEYTVYDSNIYLDAGWVEKI
jgi:hypothetical protein